MSLHTSRIEALTLLHIAAMGALSTWFLGGGSSQARLIISLLGSLAPLLTIAGLLARRQAGESIARPLLPLIPWAGFNAVILLGLLHPSLRVASVEGINVYLPVATPPGWPDSARPDLALTELWLLNAIVLTPFNILINLRHRGTLHTLFVILAVNAVLLAVFGSLQKFVSSTGIFFGAVTSPNPTFFASFIYHNHWGAFVVLSTGLWLGLLYSLRPWDKARDFWHSPAVAILAAIFLLALTVPLSGARACSLFAFLLLAAGLLQGLQRVIQYQRDRRRSLVVPGVLIACTLVAAVFAAYFLTSDVIESRLTDTHNQLQQVRDSRSLGSRAILYSDTCRMATDKLWFGWGLASYGTVFRSFNTQIGSEGLPQFYEYAHSDWLQLLAETGIVGATAYLAFLILLLLPLPRWRGGNELSTYLLNGCGLIMLYACIEFPFGNPAVSLLFWTCLMGAVRWVRLNQVTPSR